MKKARINSVQHNPEMQRSFRYARCGRIGSDTQLGQIGTSAYLEVVNQ